MKALIIVISFTILFSFAILHSVFVSKWHKPHFTTRETQPESFTKDEVDHLLNTEYILDGNNKLFGEINDVIDLKTTAIFIRGGKVKREEDREIHVVVGDANVYYCFNLIASFLTEGQKLKITCPNRILTKTTVGRIPYKTMDIEIEVLKINKAWKLNEIIETFDVKFLDEGNSKHFARLGDTIFFEYKEYALNGTLVFDWESYYSGNYDHKFVLGAHDVQECIEIVLPTSHINQNIRFKCPQEYKTRGLGDRAKIDHNFTTYIEGYVRQIRKNYREDL